MTSLAYFHDAFVLVPSLASTFSSGILTVFNLTSVIFTVLATVRGSRKKSNPIRRMIRSLYLSIAAFALFTVSVYLRGTDPLSTTYPYYLFLLGMSVILAIAQAFMQSAAMVICTQLSIDGTLMGYLQMGQALQGVFGSVVNLISTALAASIDGRHPGPSKMRARENANAATVVFLITILLQIATRVCLARVSYVPSVEAHIRKWDANMREGDADVPEPGAWERISRVQAKIWPWVTSIFTIFLVTLGVYPSLTAQVRAVDPKPGSLGENSSVFVALHIVAMNVGDLIGRRLPALSSYLLIRQGWVAVIATTSRFLFIPLFFACNIVKENGSKQTWTLPDPAFFALVLLLGITTGSNATSVFLSGPKSVDESASHEPAATEEPADDVEYDRLLDEADPPQNREASIASMILAFWLVLGLTAGSCFSFAVLAMA